MVATTSTQGDQMTTVIDTRYRTPVTRDKRTWLLQNGFGCFHDGKMCVGVMNGFGWIDGPGSSAFILCDRKKVDGKAQKVTAADSHNCGRIYCPKAPKPKTH